MALPFSLASIPNEWGETPETCESGGAAGVLTRSGKKIGEPKGAHPATGMLQIGGESARPRKKKDFVIYPRRKHGTGDRSEPVVVSLSVIQKYYDFPLHKAAEEMGISSTALKKACRRVGIKSWPYRFREPLPTEDKMSDDADEDESAEGEKSPPPPPSSQALAPRLGPSSAPPPLHRMHAGSPQLMPGEVVINFAACRTPSGDMFSAHRCMPRAGGMQVVDMVRRLPGSAFDAPGMSVRSKIGHDAGGGAPRRRREVEDTVADSSGDEIPHQLISSFVAGCYAVPEGETTREWTLDYTNTPSHTPFEMTAITEADKEETRGAASGEASWVIPPCPSDALWSTSSASPSNRASPKLAHAREH